MKKILGLDIGTNSIGGALVSLEEFGKKGKIDWMGSRIVPLDGDALAKFENGGNVETKAAARRMLRSSRRLKQRYKLRRSRLINVLKILKWVPAGFPDNFKTYSSEQPFNINHYLPFSDESKKESESVFGSSKVSEDWIVYYLRSKALTQKITFPELARILYMLNQRRGFKSSRKDIIVEENQEEKYPKLEKWVEFVKINSVTEVENEKGKTVYRIGSDKYDVLKTFKNKPDWEGKTLELEVSRKTTKSGEVTYNFGIPNPTEWEKQKTALNNDVSSWMQNGLCKSIGEYFFLQLKKDKNYRIRQRIVERKLYKEELELIWKVQSSFHKELSDVSVLTQIANVLYKKNVQKQNEIASNNLFHVLANDIIYYQRPLKSQKNLIDDCPYEKKTYFLNGIEQTAGIKVAPKSSPEFQEFRIWQDIHSIRVFRKEGVVNNKLQINIDVSGELITNEVKASLFELFNASGEISEHAVLKKISPELSTKTHRVNLFASRDKLKGNETKSVFLKVFKKYDFEEKGYSLLNDGILFYKMWHILYSLNEQEHILSAFRKLKDQNGNRIAVPEKVCEALSKLPELPSQYAAYSSKAIKKLLPLMRTGKYWNTESIDHTVLERLEKILTGEYDPEIDDRTRQLIYNFSEKNKNATSGLPIWLATYAVYEKHSERSSGEKLSNASQIEVNKLIPHNSLRNPFVEQIIRETLNLVKDIFITHGQPDEIHIELARELKKTAEEKEKIARSNQNSYVEKERIKKLLRELKKGNPDSLSDQDKFKVWKNIGGLESEQRFEKLFNIKNDFVSISDVEKYRIWAEQNCLSPYTGKAIPLSELFTSAYEIEHIFPRSRFFDDSFTNKVICEAGVNKEKDKTIARLFIQQYGGTTFTRDGKTFTLFNEESYIAHCKTIFRGRKLRNLLADSIPEDFVARQLNDTRYITKKLAGFLSPVAKDKEGIIFAGGTITNELKNKWGLNKVWKETLRPRFERLEKITGQPFIIADSTDVNKYHFTSEYKRVDHRHHALDALVIAMTTKEHIRYLNTLNASDDKEKLRYGLVKNKIRDFILPWPEFTKDVKESLEDIIVSHKAVTRVVSKPFNKYLKWVEKDGTFIKSFVKQKPPEKPGKNWISVRKSMFKEPQGVIYLKGIEQLKVNDAIAIQLKKDSAQNVKGTQPLDYIYDQGLRARVKKLIKQFDGKLEDIKKHLKKKPLLGEDQKPITKIKVARFKEYAAKRVALNSTFDEKKINKIPYSEKSPLARLLKEHLVSFGEGKPKIAFQGEGLMELEKKAGKPIKKVTIYESKDPKDKFKGKYYETDKGGNVFFVIEKDQQGTPTKAYTLPLMEAIERLANKLPLADEKSGYSNTILSPNELVYVKEEGENVSVIDWNDKKKIFGRIYKMVSCTGSECHFIPHNISKLILPYDAKTKTGEFGSLNKSENTVDGISIKRNCIKIKLDRLGNVIMANGRSIVPQLNVAESKGQ